eukprot:14475975-Ditylum_brightwellii.AAC.1
MSSLYGLLSMKRWWTMHCHCLHKHILDLGSSYGLQGLTHHAMQPWLSYSLLVPKWLVDGDCQCCCYRCNCAADSGGGMVTIIKLQQQQQQ